MSKYSLSSKNFVEYLGIVEVFNKIINEINKRNPEGDFLLIRNKILRLPPDSKKQLFVFSKFILIESFNEYEYGVSIGGNFLLKSSVLVECACLCTYSYCFSINFKIYEGWRNVEQGVNIPCKDSFEEMTERVINIILNRPNLNLEKKEEKRKKKEVN